jgi:hypothetical protein
VTRTTSTKSTGSAGERCMCHSKEKGGLGFRNFESFNQSFLAKQGWDLITIPDSLGASVLKARYYKDSEFLSVSCRKRASFTWRSIIHGIDLLKTGIVWRIGDGSCIRTMTNNWIPRSPAQHPLGCKQKLEDCPERVSEFLFPGGGACDEQKLRSYFHDEYVRDIMSTQVCR